MSRASTLDGWTGDARRLVASLPTSKFPTHKDRWALMQPIRLPGERVEPRRVGEPTYEVQHAHRVATHQDDPLGVLRS